MITAGIDPGIKGGVGFLEGDAILAVHPMPVLVGDVDTRELYALLMTTGAEEVLIEQQQILGHQQGGMAIGKNYGRLFAVVELLGLPHRVVAPAKWNRQAGIPPKLSGKAKKDASFSAAQRTWGDAFHALNLRRSQDGQVEALLIARYGR